MAELIVEETEKPFKPVHFGLKANGRKKYIGYIYKETDGYYVFAQNMTGFMSSNHLRMIADMLDKQNEEWYEKTEKELSKIVVDTNEFNFNFRSFI